MNRRLARFMVFTDRRSSSANQSTVRVVVKVIPENKTPAATIFIQRLIHTPDTVVPIDEVRQAAADDMANSLYLLCTDLINRPEYQSSKDQMDYLRAILEGYLTVLEDAGKICVQLISEMETK